MVGAAALVTVAVDGTIRRRRLGCASFCIIGLPPAESFSPLRSCPDRRFLQL